MLDFIESIFFIQHFRYYSANPQSGIRTDNKNQNLFNSRHSFRTKASSSIPIHSNTTTTTVVPAVDHRHVIGQQYWAHPRACRHVHNALSFRVATRPFVRRIVHPTNAFDASAFMHIGHRYDARGSIFPPNCDVYRHVRRLVAADEGIHAGLVERSGA